MAALPALAAAVPPAPFSATLNNQVVQKIQYAAVNPSGTKLAVRMQKEPMLAALVLLARIPALRQIAPGAPLKPAMTRVVALNPTPILPAARRQQELAHALR
jgi:hypothetical protein